MSDYLKEFHPPTLEANFEMYEPDKYDRLAELEALILSKVGHEVTDLLEWRYEKNVHPELIFSPKGHPDSKIDVVFSFDEDTQAFKVLDYEGEFKGSFLYANAHHSTFFVWPLIASVKAINEAKIKILHCWEVEKELLVKSANNQIALQTLTEQLEKYGIHVPFAPEAAGDNF